MRAVRSGLPWGNPQVGTIPESHRLINRICSLPILATKPIQHETHWQFPSRGKPLDSLAIAHLRGQNHVDDGRMACQDVERPEFTCVRGLDGLPAGSG